MPRRKKITSEKILKEMESIAFSDDEKTADRLRALDFLSSVIGESAKTEEALEKLDEILSKLGEQ